MSIKGTDGVSDSLTMKWIIKHCTKIMFGKYKVLHLVGFHKHGVFYEVHLQMINWNHLAGCYMFKWIS